MEIKIVHNKNSKIERYGYKDGLQKSHVRRKFNSFGGIAKKWMGH